MELKVNLSNIFIYLDMTYNFESEGKCDLKSQVSFYKILQWALLNGIMINAIIQLRGSIETRFTSPK